MLNSIKHIIQQVGQGLTGHTGGNPIIQTEDRELPLEDSRGIQVTACSLLVLCTERSGDFAGGLVYGVVGCMNFQGVAAAPTIAWAFDRICKARG